MRLGLRPRLGVVAAAVLVAGASITITVGGSFATDAPNSHFQPARAVAPGDPDPDLEIAPARATETRAPRPADSPPFATLAVLAALVALAAVGATLRHRPWRSAVIALVPCGVRAPPALLST